MLNNFLTVIIPCKNSVIPLKKTIEDIAKKTKIKNTRVIVLDFGSTDGSYQYAAQASSEFIRIMKIESVMMKENESIRDSLNLIDTPYILLMTPGSTFKDQDLFISSVNELSKIDYPIAYLRNSDSINNFISSFIKNRRKIDAIFSEKKVLNSVEYEYEDTNADIKIIDLPKGIKIGGFTN